MKLFTLFITLFLSAISVSGQTLYTKAYGNAKDTPIIFIHGGPSGNGTLFEGTTAKKLSEKGFYVIVYDRRGEGRSIDSTVKFTYNEAFNDLNNIYKQYNLTKANIIGHSFGGLVSTLYTEKYPTKVSSLVLAGALFSQQETYNHILSTLKKTYTDNNDTTMLEKLLYIENLDKHSAEYRKGCYELAGERGFFKVPSPSEEAIKLKKEYEASEFYKTNIRNKNAAILFYKNEPLNNINTKTILAKLKRDKMKIYAIYGKQDGIFSNAQIQYMQELVGKNNFKLIDNCSHYLFVDQQKAFLDGIEKWLK